MAHGTRLDDLQPGDTCEVANVARDERQTRLEADAGLHRVAHVDSGASGAHSRCRVPARMPASLVNIRQGAASSASTCSVSRA